MAASNTDIATFTSAFTATQVGINMGTNSLNLGAISLDSSRITATSIGNSSGTAGVLRLYGATVSGVNNVILNNAGTGLLTLQAAQSGTMGVVLSNATNNIIRITNTGGVTISSIISGSGSNLTLQGGGAGVLTLTGANTYSGTTSINSGTLALSGTATGTILNTSGITLNGGILQLTNNTTTGIVADRVNDSATITSNGGRIDFTNTNTASTTYAETLGTVALTTSHLVLNQTVDNAALSTTQTLTLSSLTHTGASNTSTVSFVALTTGPNATKNRFLVSGSPSNTNGIIGAWAITNNVVSGSSTTTDYAKFDGSGYVVPLAAALTSTEADLVSGANINWNNAALNLTANRSINTLRLGLGTTVALGSGSNTLATFGVLAAAGGGSTISGTGTTFLTIPTAAPGGAVGESANLYLSTAGRTLTITAPIKDNGLSKLTLVKSGLGGTTSAGNLVLGSTGNSYSGDTVVNEGDLNLNASGVIPDGAGKGNLVLDGSNARLTMNNNLGSPTAYSETINGLNGRGIVQNGVTTGSLTVTLTVGSGDANGNFSGTLVNNTTTNTNGLLALTKIGTGTQTLSGANTYTGATSVRAGTLLIGTSGSLGITAVTVGGAGTTGTPTLAGGGTIGGATTIAAAGGGVVGTHAVGVTGVNNGVGTQTFTSTLNYGSSSIFEWNLQAIGTTDIGVVANGATGTYDKVIASGAANSVTGAGAVFKIMLGGNAFTDAFWNTDKTWTDIFSGTGAPANLASIFTTFSGTNVNTDGKVIGRVGNFTFNGSSTLTWSAVPEPSSALAGLLLGAGLLRRRRKC